MGNRLAASCFVMTTFCACIGGSNHVPASGAGVNDQVDTDDTASALGEVVAFDEGSGTTAKGSSQGVALTLQNAHWTVGKMGTAVDLDGKSSQASSTTPLVDNSASFSVAAWVQLGSTNQMATILSQDGNVISGYSLQYAGTYGGDAAGKFIFTLASGDATSASLTRATSLIGAVADSWYHVVGVYDAKAATVAIYVNGQLQSRAVAGNTFVARGATAVGRALWNGKTTDFWPGRIDDVHLYNSAITADQVIQLMQMAPAITPVRPPATPLVTRMPYVNVWQASNAAAGKWPSFWNGKTKGLTGLVRVDQTTYVFFGAPGNLGVLGVAQQIQEEVTPTQSRYTFTAGPTTLHVNFVSPVEAHNLQALSMPLGYIIVQAQTNDGLQHQVSVYMDISGEWAHGTATAPIAWSYGNIPGSTGLNAYSISAAAPNPLAETNDYPSWGSAIWAAGNGNITYEAGEDLTVRSHYVASGSLDNSIDQAMPRAIDANWPVFAYNYNLGSVGGNPTAPSIFVLGHVRQPSASYLSAPMAPLWQSYWPTWQAMVGAAFADAQSGGMLQRADSLDSQVNHDAVAAGGAHYAALCALALRQAFAGVELVGTPNAPWLLLKEISSDGNVSTADVVYPSMPAFLYTNPLLLRLLLTPLISYAESGNWPQTFAEHDLGACYPNATGHNDGGGEVMPVEESANMLLMTAAYLQADGSADAVAFVRTHYVVLKQWADYLVTNTVDPGFQNQTDDFTGFIAHSSNLALKGILALGAMSKIATAVGNDSDANFYEITARNDIAQWQSLAMDSSGKHLKLAYDQDGTWSLKYNAFPDKLLGLNLIAPSVSQNETAWYVSQMNTYGVPLDNRHTYTKADWEMWTAAATDSASLRQQIIDAEYQFVNTSASRVPFSDWYDTLAGTQNGFEARPVVGAIFSILTRVQSGH